MRRFIVAALAALAASTASIASARDDEPSAEQIEKAASLIMGSGLDNKMSEREIANTSRRLGPAVRTRQDQHVDHERGKR